VLKYYSTSTNKKQGENEKIFSTLSYRIFRPPSTCPMLPLISRSALLS